MSPPCHSSPPWAKAGFKMVRSLLHLRPCELSLFIYSFFLSIDLSGSTAKSVSTGRSGSLRGRSVFSSLLCDDRPDCRVMLYSLSLSLSASHKPPVPPNNTHTITVQWSPHVHLQIFVQQAMKCIDLARPKFNQSERV